MYCQSCGNQINDDLSFCNRCGNRVIKNELATRGASANTSVLKSLSIATGFVGVIGSGGLLALIIIIVSERIESPAAFLFALLFAATVFGICFMMTRQISRLAGVASSDLPVKPIFKIRREPEQLNPADAAAEFQSPAKSFRSVTENTTRTLDKNNA